MGIKPNERIILALDFDTRSEVEHILRCLKGRLSYVKVGMQLFYAEGKEIITFLKQQGLQIFLDLKILDIPNTAAKAVLNFAKLDVQMITIHATGGSQMISAVREVLDPFPDRPKILAVTQLTSISPYVFYHELGGIGSLSEHVLKLALVAQESGADGAVVSGQEVELLRNFLSPHFFLVTPGVRFSLENSHDQARVVTPKKAIQAGASYLVVGREVTMANQPEKVFDRIVQSISEKE